MKRIKVMIVDDDIILLEELKNTLALDNIEAETLNDGAFTVKTAEEKQPDVIVLDLKMAGKSGFQIADDLKHFAGTANIPIIAMTGHFTGQQHRKFMDSIGFSDCVIKPFNPQYLVSKIRQFAKGS